jgi:hypothetical protein
MECDRKLPNRMPNFCLISCLIGCLIVRSSLIRNLGFFGSEMHSEIAQQSRRWERSFPMVAAMAAAGGSAKNAKSN